MDRRIIIACLLCLVCASPASARWGGVFVGFGQSAGGTTTYIGYPNTDGTPSATPASYYGAASVVVATKWMASAGGTLKTINAYVNLRSGTINHEKVCVYKDITGTLTLIATGAYTGVQGAWTGNVTLVAESGQSLDFTTGDVLYFGGSANSNNTYRFGRDDTGGTGMYDAASATAGPPATITFGAVGTGRNMAFIMGYE